MTRTIFTPVTAPVAQLPGDAAVDQADPGTDRVPVRGDPLPGTIGDVLAPGHHYEPLNGPLWGPPGHEVWLPQVRQGGLGDCVTMATLGAYALQQPWYLRSMARELPDGSVAFKLPGKPEFAVSRNVVTNDKGFPKYARPQKHMAWKAAWPAMFEKAIVSDSHFGYYKTIAAAISPPKAMGWISGVSPRGTQTPDSVAADLSKRLSDGEPMIATSEADPSRSLKLVGPHSYVVRKVVERPGEEPLIKVWNPWGSDQPHAMTEEQFRQNFHQVIGAWTKYNV